MHGEDDEVSRTIYGSIRILMYSWALGRGGRESDAMPCCQVSSAAHELETHCLLLPGPSPRAVSLRVSVVPLAAHQVCTATAQPRALGGWKPRQRGPRDIPMHCDSSTSRTVPCGGGGGGDSSGGWRPSLRTWPPPQCRSAYKRAPSASPFAHYTPRQTQLLSSAWPRSLASITSTAKEPRCPSVSAQARQCP